MYYGLYEDTTVKFKKINILLYNCTIHGEYSKNKPNPINNIVFNIDKLTSLTSISNNILYITSN